VYFDTYLNLLKLKSRTRTRTRTRSRTRTRMSTSVRRCGICRTSGHNRRCCPAKKHKGNIVFGYTPLVLSIFDFLVTDHSYEQLYALSKVSSTFQKAVHFITKKTVDFCVDDVETFCNKTIKYIQPFTQLRTLCLSYLHIARPTGYIHSGFKHLSSLTELIHLDISYNRKIPSNVLLYFKNNKNLQHLKISQCYSRINDRSLSYLKYFPDLRYLNLRGNNRITDLSFLRHCPKLETLKIDIHHMGDGSFDCLKFCPNLKSLSTYRYNDSTCDIDFKDLSCLHSLERLHLQGASKISNSDIDCLEHLQSLTYLDLDTCRGISDLSFLKLCPNLETLAFEQDGLDEGSFESLKLCPKLKSLSINCYTDNARDIEFQSLSSLHSLERLCLLGAPIIDDIDVVYLARLQSLNYLLFDNCDYIHADLSILNHISDVCIL